MKFMSNIADTLADHGHEVVVFQQQIVESMRNKKVIKNPDIKIINYEANTAGKEFYRNRPKSSVTKYWTTNQAANPSAADQFAEAMSKDLEHMCLQVFEDKSLHTMLKSENFDVLIAEPFDPCGLYLGDYLKIPSTIIAMASSRIDPVQWALGQPSGLNFIPGPDSKYGVESGVWDRINNVWMFFMRTRMFRTVYWNLLDKLELKTGLQIRNIDEIVADSAYLFYNSNPYLDFPFPSLTKCVPIGGFSVNTTTWKSEKLPENLNNILQKRPHTVYISFGSVIRSADMPQEYKNAIIEVTKLMSDVTFIWKYEDEEDEEMRRNIPENVHLIKWLPQSVLLADSRVSLFITHGGLGSIMEVAYSGKPAIVVPLFFDQPMNGEMLRRHGGAEVYSKFDLSDAQKLKGVIQNMIRNPKYLTSAKKLSNLLQKQPINPIERLVKHAEFAAEFKKLPELDPYSRHLNFFQFFFLDIVATLLIFFMLSALFVYWITYVICSVKYKSKME